MQPLTIEADLDIAVDGETVHVHGAGDHLIVDVPSLRTGRTLMRSGPFAGQRAEPLGRFQALLAEAGLTAEVRVGGQTFARMGKGVETSRAAKLLRLGDIEVRFSQPLVASMRRNGWLAAGLGFALALGLTLYAKLRDD